MSINRLQILWQDKILEGSQFWRYLLSLLLVAIATALSGLVEWEFSPTNLIMIYMLAVVVTAIYLGRGPALLSAFAGVLAFDFFFVPPIYTFNVADTEYLLSLVGFLLLGLTISYLTAEAQEKAQAAQRREAETAALYALSRDLTIIDDIDGICSTLSTHIQSILKCKVHFFLPDGRGRRQPPASHRRSRMKRLIESDARIVLAWIGKRDRRGRRLW